MPESTAITQPVIVHFGRPEHGWLPVTLQAGVFQLKLDFSDVPVNPLELLCTALATTVAGGSGQVLWFLEPAECWFTFDNQAGTISLTITETPNEHQALTTTQHLTGTIGHLLVPFYRAIQRFTARRYPKKHWPCLDKALLERLGRLVQPYF